MHCTTRSWLYPSPRCREGGTSMDWTARIGCKPMHMRRRDASQVMT
uniref:Uncharacterized protein n=1 Tax=Triticum urartu TaxID=4572 RepID=A0A8R7QKM9_TRIUA